MAINIKVVREYLPKEHSIFTGGEYAINTLEIYIDKDLPLDAQRERVIHSILENYFQHLEHSKIEEITNLIVEALDDLAGEV